MDDGGVSRPLTINSNFRFLWETRR